MSLYIFLATDRHPQPNHHNSSPWVVFSQNDSNNHKEENTDNFMRIIWGSKNLKLKKGFILFFLEIGFECTE